MVVSAGPVLAPRALRFLTIMYPLHGNAASLHVENHFSDHYNGMLTMLFLCLRFNLSNMEVAKKFIQVFPFWPAQ